MISLADDPSMSIADLLKLIPSITGTAAILIGFYMLYSGKLVTCRELDKSEAETNRMRAERDTYLSMALRSLENNEALRQTTDRAVSATSRAVVVADQAIKSGDRRSAGVDHGQG